MNDPGSDVGRLVKAAKAVRTPGEAIRFARWSGAALKRRLFVGPARSRQSPDAQARADYELGIELATIGAQAARVFSASSKVGVFDPEATHDLVIGDESAVPESVAGLYVPLGRNPMTHVAAFDAETNNPIRWIRDHDQRVLSVGPVAKLPSGVTVDASLEADDPEAARHAHHLVDVAAFHASTRERAATLVALAARGVVVLLADSSRELEDLVGTDLHRLLSDPGIANASVHERERASISMRRLALRDHSLRARVRQVATIGGLDRPSIPEVSIVLATNRPDYIDAAFEAVGRQTYPRLEVVLALHGPGFDGDVETHERDLPHALRVIRVGQEVSFGNALNLAVTASGGTLLTKFDDDDLYSAEHVWDLVLAHEYSQAQLVAKAAEFVYLAGSDATIHRFAGRGETYSRTLAGGTMLISRHDLEAAGGWRRVPRGVDKALIEDVANAGGRIFRTHGFGYVLVRHGRGHTWASDDSYFLDEAQDHRDGLDRGFAGV